MNTTAITQNQQATMSSREIAELTGKRHGDVIRDIRAMVTALARTDYEDSVTSYDWSNTPEKVSGFLRHQENHGVTEEKDSRGYTQYFLLDRYHTEVLVTGYDVKRRAAVIRRWHDLETGAAKPVAELANVPATIALVECAANLLRTSDSGKVVMLRKAGQAVGADTSFLPDYTEDSAPGHVGAMDTASLTQLLRDHGLSHSAAAVNQALHDAGILESRTRKSNKGALKHFWCLTDAGQNYGKNVVSPQSPRETQPHYYRAHFTELLGLIGLEGDQ
ncbi:regulatory protein Rha [Kushneria sinocarnis]|uniref:Regulatory protein Rha n=1 Tax=Kushneria sinocarnis TaxID=595502 RepID=A0A420WUI5_9GAMM|nr:Rha family transcriptional regulator [Kushneria sinocarnis]RKQ97119.1 regulatory protein Rha [Kushneria sinocarnis]